MENSVQDTNLLLQKNKEDLPGSYEDIDGTAVSNRKGYHIDVRLINMPIFAKKWCR